MQNRLASAFKIAGTVRCMEVGAQAERAFVWRMLATSHSHLRYIWYLGLHLIMFLPGVCAWCVFFGTVLNRCVPRSGRSAASGMNKYRTDISGSILEQHSLPAFWYLGTRRVIQFSSGWNKRWTVNRYACRFIERVKRWLVASRARLRSMRRALSSSNLGGTARRIIGGCVRIPLPEFNKRAQRLAARRHRPDRRYGRLVGYRYCVATALMGD